MDNNNLYVRKNMNHTTVILLVTSLATVFVIFISIAYAAINADLMISGDLSYEADKDQSLHGVLRKSSKGLDTNIDLSVAPTEETSGVYEIDSTKNDTNPVYYYRGIVNNNNVSFAGFCWKMVRTTETGGVKLIYNGIPAEDGSCNNTGTSSQIGTNPFNSNYSDIKYIGYTYDTNENSLIKTYIDDWYSKNMVSYTGMLEDTEWCNDRNISSTSGSDTYYEAYARNVDSWKPSILCSNESDKYTVSNSIGNGLLKYPVALLTADEATLAGHGWHGYTSKSYLRTGQYWWTMSPYSFDNAGAREFSVLNGLNSDYVNGLRGVRPAISLSSETIVNGGDGTSSNPYTVIEKKDTLYQLVSRGAKLDTNLDFSVAPTEETSGVYEIDSTKNDTNPVYYYRGIISNNNVKFANFCWKIVRTTSTGGVKLIYNGVPGSDGSCNNTGEASQIGESAFNENFDDAKYVGYTYDGSTDSTIKAYIDNWYSKNMISYTGMLEDTEWCNDRSVYEQTEDYIFYGATERNEDSDNPSIVCSNESDKYTVSSSKGNGLLKYPVALLTADEITLAGQGHQGYTQSGYLNTGGLWWALSPSNFYNSNAREFFVSSDGDLYNISVDNSDGVRPAVSLSSETIVNGGDGTSSNPYTVIEKKDTLYQMVSRGAKLDTNLDFSVAPTEATSGVYEIDSTKNDTNPVYYYRGIISNNNVKFANFCWKIVRTTSTGGVKLIYNGVPGSDGSCNNTGKASQIGESAFSSTYNGAKYVGYTYDTNTDSTIKEYIDTWYKNNMTSYTNMLEDTIWCNDRSISSTSGSIIYYGAYGRLTKSPYKPSIECQQAGDRYTVSSSKGNGLLKYPIALLTADEATLAGQGHQGYTQSGYLRTDQYWWALSPNYFDYYTASEFLVDSTGYLGNYYRVDPLLGVRPAVSLAPGTMMSEGDGTVSNPYQVKGG